MYPFIPVVIPTPPRRTRPPPTPIDLSMMRRPPPLPPPIKKSCDLLAKSRQVDRLTPDEQETMLVKLALHDEFFDWCNYRTMKRLEEKHSLENDASTRVLVHVYHNGDQVEWFKLHLYYQNNCVNPMWYRADTCTIIRVKESISCQLYVDLSDLRLSLVNAEDPSAPCSSWVALEDDVLLNSLGTAFVLRVEIRLTRDQEIARKVEAVSLEGPNECHAIEQLSAIVEPLSKDSSEDIKSLTRSLVDRALSEEETGFPVDNYMILFKILGDRWFGVHAFPDQPLVHELVNYTKDEWEQVNSALNRFWSTWVWHPQKKLRALTKFICRLWDQGFLDLSSMDDVFEVVFEESDEGDIHMDSEQLIAGCELLEFVVSSFEGEVCSCILPWARHNYANIHQLSQKVNKRKGWFSIEAEAKLEEMGCTLFRLVEKCEEEERKWSSVGNQTQE